LDFFYPVYPLGPVFDIVKIGIRTQEVASDEPVQLFAVYCLWMFQRSFAGLCKVWRRFFLGLQFYSYIAQQYILRQAWDFPAGGHILLVPTVPVIRNFRNSPALVEFPVRTIHAVRKTLRFETF
jgi:hypothetical protein